MRPKVAHVPPPPVAYMCSVNPSAVYPGDPIRVTGTASNINPAKPTTYVWLADGVPLVANGPSLTIDTTGYVSGSHSVQGRVSEGPNAGETIDCSVQFTERAFEPPTIGCIATPSIARPGDEITVKVSGASPQNRPLNYSFSTSFGTIRAVNAEATLSTFEATPGDTIAVTCNTVDDKGEMASASTSIQIIAREPQPQPTAMAPRCDAVPATVRPGQRVSFKVAADQIMAGDQVRWETSVSRENLDQNGGVGVFDTGHLLPGNYSALATIKGGGMIRQCTAHFTIDPHANVPDWQSIS